MEENLTSFMTQIQLSSKSATLSIHKDKLVENEDFTNPSYIKMGFLESSLMQGLYQGILIFKVCSTHIYWALIKAQALC